MKNMLLLAMTVNLAANAASTSMQRLSPTDLQATMASLDTQVQPYYQKHFEVVLQKYEIDEKTWKGTFNLIGARLKGIPVEKIAQTRALREIVRSPEFTTSQKTILKSVHLFEEMETMIAEGKCVKIFSSEEVQKHGLQALNSDQAAEKLLTNQKLLSKADKLFDRYQKLRHAKNNLSAILNATQSVSLEQTAIDNQIQLLFSQLRSLVRAALIPN